MRRSHWLTQYTYDERNLMTGYVDATNQIVYNYNGDAQRVSETLNGALMFWFSVNVSFGIES